MNDATNPGSLRRAAESLAETRLADAHWGSTTAGSGDAMTITSPADGRLLAEVPLANADDVDRAVHAASMAFPSWSATQLVERIACIRGLIEC